MGRIGVGYLEVSKAAGELQGKGINPTVDNVRFILGTGSRSTIGPYLKEWRDKHEETRLYSEIPHELSSIVKGLYDRLQEEASIKIANIEEEAKKEISKIQQDYECLLKDKILLDEKILELTQKLNEAIMLERESAIALENSNKTNIILETKAILNEQRIQDKDKHIGLLEASLSTLQSQRLEEKQDSERIIAILQQEVFEIKNREVLYNQSVEKLYKDIELLQNENDQHEKEYYSQREKVITLQEELKLKEYTISDLEKQYYNSHVEKEISHQKYRELHEIFIKREKNILLAAEKINILEQSLLVEKSKMKDLLKEKQYMLAKNDDLKQQLNNILAEIPGMRA